MKLTVFLQSLQFFCLTLFCYTKGLAKIFTFIEHFLFIINHSKLFFSKQFHFISPIAILLMFIIPLLMVCVTHQLECVNTPEIQVCQLHFKWCASWDKCNTPYLVCWTHFIFYSAYTEHKQQSSELCISNRP